MSVDAIFFCMEEFNDTPFLHLYFHVDAILKDSLLPSVAQQQNVVEYWQEGSTSTAIPSTTASNIMGQHKKNRRHNFGTALVFVLSVLIGLFSEQVCL